MKHLKQLFLLLLFASYGRHLSAQCADAAHIYSFTHGGKTYEIIREAKTWVDAAACAASRGGYLAEINSQAENDAVFTHAVNDAGIDLGNTWAPNGGGAYLWLGGNDRATEGHWIWDGDNNQSGTPFWIGDTNGAPVNNAYTNWGNEPDNSNNQDALALSLNGWPFGNAGQWNDLAETNTLYFVIEYPTTVGTRTPEPARPIAFPNPSPGQFTIRTGGGAWHYTVRDLSGCTIRSGYSTTPGIRVDLTGHPAGQYIVRLTTSGGEIRTVRLIKQ